MTRTVGFIGLGNMGGPMALNLVKAGFELVVHDINPARVAPLVAAGATVEASAEAVAAKCHRTICMVETTDQAESVILGENGIIQSAKQGDIVLCMSTIDPLAARRFAERLGAKGVTMLDAPVSGGTHGAAAATLSVIVGGLAETFAASEDLVPRDGQECIPCRRARAWIGDEADQQHARPDRYCRYCRGAGVRQEGWP